MSADHAGHLRARALPSQRAGGTGDFVRAVFPDALPADVAPALQALADACVEGVDRHRAPPDEAELARRRGAGLSPEREANLRRWGYPDVFETWRFHMTLTGPNSQRRGSYRVGASNDTMWYPY